MGKQLNQQLEEMKTESVNLQQQMRWKKEPNLLYSTAGGDKGKGTEPTARGYMWEQLNLLLKEIWEMVLNLQLEVTYGKKVNLQLEKIWEMVLNLQLEVTYGKQLKLQLEEIWGDN